jgi:[citrate (pro-3S)-lyase] ligase
MEYLDIPPAPPPTERNYGLTPEQLVRLEEYKAVLAAFYEEQFGDRETPPKIGAIVMNCNPFTLGHRRLIEQCAGKVDFLIVFVVREDKSFFPFEDRMGLVDRGTEDLPNVGVIESGNFIISSLTFREYFNKSELQDKIVDSSNDVTLFAREIAPAAHISVRFAGSEPFDRVTKQYNDALAGILPRYGIAFEVIPRFELGGEAISASRVRDLLAKNKLEEIKKLVPKTTYDYLLKLPRSQMQLLNGRGD